VRAQLLKSWDNIRSSFWFVPALMAVGAVMLAIATVAADRTSTNTWLRAASWVYSGSAEGASVVLGTIAGSMITIAGVVFSMTLVALSLASSQLGPRLLRNFMRDKTNQMVLGTFVATFVYCLLVLRTIRRVDEGAFVPHVSVTIGVLFALASLAVLIHFIHHVSLSIQADEIVARVAKELDAGIDRNYPEVIGRGGCTAGLSSSDRLILGKLDREANPVGSDLDGYVQFIEDGALMELATKYGAILQIERRPGQYVVKGTPLLRCWAGDNIDAQFCENVNAAFVLGTQRTTAQDVEFSVHQLVEIALRALSPGINDSFTALACVDRLTSALHRLAARAAPSPYRHDERNRLRIVTTPVTFPLMLGEAFNQIRQHARSNAAVTVRLLESIITIGSNVRRAQDKSALALQANLIFRGAMESLPEWDRREIEERYIEARSAVAD
jgi:uncharacterized membrane protein